jgi:hypothetical protein
MTGEFLESKASELLKVLKTDPTVSNFFKIFPIFIISTINEPISEMMNVV